jgi:hypothetical protein
MIYERPSLSEENCQIDQEEKYHRNKGGSPLISNISQSVIVFCLISLPNFIPNQYDKMVQ